MNQLRPRAGDSCLEAAPQRVGRIVPRAPPRPLSQMNRHWSIRIADLSAPSAVEADNAPAAADALPA